MPSRPIRQACRNRFRPDLALFEVVEDDAVDASPQHRGEMVLSLMFLYPDIQLYAFGRSKNRSERST
jgi:hypothetical protein